MNSELGRGLGSVGRGAVGIVCGLAFLLLRPPAPVSAQTTLEPVHDPLAGPAVFEAKGCVKCHAINGLGGTAGPDLGAIPGRRSFAELAASLWNHIPLMGVGVEKYGVEQPQLTAHEAGDLIGYLFTLDYFDPPGDVTAGQRLFVEKKCFACHRVGNYGGDMGPNLDFVGQYGSPILVAAGMLNHGDGMRDSMEAHGIMRPTFEGSELVDLIAYIESAAPEPLEGRLYVLPGRAAAGRVIFVEKRCNHCHSVQGIGGQLASDLAKKGRHWGLTEFAAAMWNKWPAMGDMLAREKMRVPQLGAVELADLVAYLYAIEYFAEVGDAEMGRQRVTDSGCLACHSLAGKGGNLANDLAGTRRMESPAEVIATLWNHAFLVGRGAADEMGYSWPKLGPEEMADLLEYFQTPPEER